VSPTAARPAPGEIWLPHQGSTAGKHGSTKGIGDEQGAGRYFPSGVADKTAARWGALGIEKAAHHPFACKFDGHEHEAHIHPVKGGHWLYACEGLDRELGVAGVRAMLAYGDDRRLSGQELSRWLERLDWEAELRARIPLDLRLPDGCPKSARILAEHMGLFVGLRDHKHFALSNAFVWATHGPSEQIGFGCAYSGLTKDRVIEGRGWLERAAVIRRVGMCNRAIQWRLAAQDRLIDTPPLAAAVLSGADQ
jgi:hypothetical protein